jgi:hypothetical protein
MVCLLFFRLTFGPFLVYLIRLKREGGVVDNL